MATTSTSEDDETQLKLKKSLHFTIGKMCDEIGKEKDVIFDREFVAALMETVYRQAQLYALDLEAFARHAKRTIINAEDVKLLARRNKLLTSHIEKIIEENEQSKKELNKNPKKRKQKSDATNVEAEQYVVEDLDTKDSDMCLL